MGMVPDNFPFSCRDMQFFRALLAMAAAIAFGSFTGCRGGQQAAVAIARSKAMLRP